MEPLEQTPVLQQAPVTDAAREQKPSALGYPFRNEKGQTPGPKPPGDRIPYRCTILSGPYTGETGRANHVTQDGRYVRVDLKLDKRVHVAFWIRVTDVENCEKYENYIDSKLPPW